MQKLFGRLRLLIKIILTWLNIIGIKQKKAFKMITGNYLSDSRDMYLQTINMIDPDTVLGSTLYYLKLSIDKNAIYGGTTNTDGERPGSFYAILNKNFTQKEFDAMKCTMK